MGSDDEHYEIEVEHEPGDALSAAVDTMLDPDSEGWWVAVVKCRDSHIIMGRGVAGSQQEAVEAALRNVDRCYDCAFERAEPVPTDPGFRNDSNDNGGRADTNESDAPQDDSDGDDWADDEDSDEQDWSDAAPASLQRDSSGRHLYRRISDMPKAAPTDLGQGTTVAEWLRGIHPEYRRNQMALTMARAVEEKHREGIVVGLVSPAKMVSRFGSLAADRSEDLSRDSPYIAPELKRGGRPSFNSDVFGLGVAVVELHTGHAHRRSVEATPRTVRPMVRRMVGPPETRPLLTEVLDTFAAAPRKAPPTIDWTPSDPPDILPVFLVLGLLLGGGFAAFIVLTTPSSPELPEPLAPVTGPTLTFPNGSVTLGEGVHQVEGRFNLEPHPHEKGWRCLDPGFRHRAYQQLVCVETADGAVTAIHAFASWGDVCSEDDWRLTEAELLRTLPPPGPLHPALGNPTPAGQARTLGCSGPPAVVGACDHNGGEQTTCTAGWQSAEVAVQVDRSFIDGEPSTCSLDIVAD